MSWSRRAVLRSAAASIALPFLPSLLPRAHAAATPPVRLLFFFVPNGLRMDRWRPTGEGAGFTLGPTMAGLEGVKDDLVVISGLDLAAARAGVPGDHPRASGSFLTCAPVQLDGVRNGVSVDQVAAAHNGGETTFRSLELGSEVGIGAGACEGGYSCAYAHNVSWAGPTTPLPKQTSARAVFDRLFGATDAGFTPDQLARRAAYHGSVLDHVGAQATALKGRLASEDRYRLDEYLAGVRELEQRVGDLDACGPEDAPPDTVALRDHPDVMLDLAVAALACGHTRYVTYMLGDAASSRVYSFLPGVTTPHHTASHHEGSELLLDQLSAIDRWETDRFARLVQRMKDTPLGNGSLLDHSIVLFGSGISDGNRHLHDDLPIVVAGRGGGAVATGRHLVVPERTPLANLHTSLLQAAGVPTAAFGDATGPLAGLDG